MTLQIAYLSNGKLYVKPDEAPAAAIDSQFGNSVRERVEKMQQRGAWKRNGIVNMLLPPRLAAETEGDRVVPIHMQAVCSGPSGKLLYALKAGSVSGIFALEALHGAEQRLFHGSDFQIRDLSLHDNGKQIACALQRQDGSANVATMAIDGIRPQEVTEGDSLDLAPRWLPGDRRALVFQSAGIGRNAEGFLLEIGPFAIVELDLDRRTVTTLAADPKFDLLSPVVAADGTLYYLRRPYQPYGDRASWWGFLRELVLLPFRLAYAIFMWLNYFSDRFTGQPLLKQNRVQAQGSSAPLVVWGKAIDPDAAVKRYRNTADEEAPPLVPKTWQLVRQQQHRDPEILAEGVLSFDVAANGTVVYANGSAVYAQKPGGVPARLLRDRCIERVILLSRNDADFAG